MADKLVYRDPAECLVGVLAAIDDIDPSVEGITGITIWKFSEGISPSSPWAWSVTLGREINSGGKLREPHPDGQHRDKSRWRAQAIAVYDTIRAQMEAGDEKLYAKG